MPGTSELVHQLGEEDRKLIQESVAEAVQDIIQPKREKVFLIIEEIITRLRGNVEFQNMSDAAKVFAFDKAVHQCREKYRVLNFNGWLLEGSVVRREAVAKLLKNG